MSGKQQGEDQYHPLSTEEQQFQADFQWAKHDPQVRSAYAGKIVAVCNRRVIAAAKTLTELQQRLDRLPKNDPRRPRWVVVSIGAF